jgi:undecaprenyl-diphosphatase
MKFRLFFFALSVVFFVLFYLFSWQVKQERFQRINFDTTVRLQDNTPPRFVELFEDLAFFVSPAMSVGFVGVLTGIAFASRLMRWKALLIPLAFGALVGAELYGKQTVESPAPPYFMIKNPTTIFPRYHVQEQYSYPSGHAARSVFLSGVASIIAYQYIKKKFFFFLFSFFCFLFSVLISIGKMYLGHHWLSDIVGGWMIACAFLSFLMSIWKIRV